MQIADTNNWRKGIQISAVGRKKEMQITGEKLKRRMSLTPSTDDQLVHAIWPTTPFVFNRSQKREKQKQRMSNISSLEFSLKKKLLSVKVGQYFRDIEIVLQSPSASLSLSLSAFPQMLLVCTPCLAQVWTLHQMWRDLRRSTLVSK